MAGNGDTRIFPADEMTSRQRLLAAYTGQAVDRLQAPGRATTTRPRVECGRNAPS